ncbi:hypothetical protein [Plasmodium yoelii yoelii]|uniref:Uncharacterized protein n=1 Tax=Plasmodium yoelii yoelii TaxID=73239 RepID=Q7RFU6_PLAYO|nr:hypothetical protein [Plasmodium yoelii yoelii]
MLTQLFFCLSLIFKQNIWVYKNWRKINLCAKNWRKINLCAKNWRKISKANNIEIVENLYEIINIIFKKGWVCNNDDKNFLIYIYLLYFNRMIIKKKEIKIKFFKKKEGKEFLQITQNYINEMNKILNSPLTQQHSTFSLENKYLRNNFYDTIPNKKYTLYYNLNDWNNLATILQKNYRSTNILYLFICRKKEIEHSLKLASFRASNLGPPFCRL